MILIGWQKQLINFDNVAYIDYEGDGNEPKEYELFAETINDTHIGLANYKTTREAEFMLNKIKDAYIKGYKTFEIPKRQG